MKKYTPFILLFILLTLVSCNSNSSNKLESFDIKNKEKRIEVLSEQIKEYSEILDTDFSLFNANGFGNNFIFLPAPSSLDYKIAIKIHKENIGSWLKGMYEAKNPNAQDSVWINSILENLENKRRKYWEKVIKESKPTRFTISSTNGRSKIAIIYWKEGVIFERIVQN